MSLESLLDLSASRNGFVKEEISEERLREHLEEVRQKIAFYREYPDYFIDDIKGPDSVFNFRFSQRIFFRAVMRHKFVYGVYPRGYSKSFIAMGALFLKAILFPNSHLFVTTGGKEQASSITIAKIEEWCKLVPALNNEINWERGQSKKSKDSVKYIFKNGSTIDILAARESSRGQRRTGGIMEEAILIDKDALNEIIIPTTNIDRMLADGSYDREEVVNQSQTFITTAGWKDSFAYEKLQEMLIKSIIYPDQYMILGSDYELSILEGAVKETMIDDMKLDGTYDPDSFDREYMSRWSGDAENAFFSSDGFDKCRQLLQPEHEYSGRTSKSGYYILGVDVGRFKCTTEVCVFKVTPQPQGTALKSLVYIYSYEAEDFEAQAIKIKKLYYKYKARTVVIDANGVGAGLVDFMILSQIDPETGDTLPAFGVEGGTNEDAYEKYKKVKGDNVELNAMYLMKASAPLNTEMYAYAKSQLASSKIKMLIDEREASAKLLTTKVGQNMTPAERNEYLYPFVQTTILKAQTMNLVEDNQGINIILKPKNNSITHDKVSAFLYALYYVKQDEERKRKRKTSSISQMMFFTNH